MKFRALFMGLLGLVFISYVVGAAVMFFQFPTSGFLSKGFMGVRAWAEKKQIVQAQPQFENSQLLGNTIDRPGKTFDGYTLYAYASLSNPSNRVSLINMQREVVHRWTASFSKIWPNPPHLNGHQIDDSSVSVFACHMYPNGDLLVVFHGLQFHAKGYGLAKLDKDSNLIWSYSANVHHDVVVGEDGTIYTLTQVQAYERPKGLENISLPWSVDQLVMLSPDGKELQPPISILDAIRNSSYQPILSPLETPLESSSELLLTDKSANDIKEQQNVLHANSLDVLNPSLARAFPQFKAGQVLVTLRNAHALALIDPTTRSIAWASCGPWHFQHNAQFLPSGRLMIFDNMGSPRGSRVLEYDPKDGSFPWVYPGVDHPPFYSPVRGMAQRLPNGNTLIVNSEEKEMFEVTMGKELVWSCGLPDHITTAKRYAPEQVTFLKPGERPRH